MFLLNGQSSPKVHLHKLIIWTAFFTTERLHLINSAWKVSWIKEAPWRALTCTGSNEGINTVEIDCYRKLYLRHKVFGSVGEVKPWCFVFPVSREMLISPGAARKPTLHHSSAACRACSHCQHHLGLLLLLWWWCCYIAFFSELSGFLLRVCFSAVWLC